MADHRLLDGDGNVMKTFASEDGKNYRHHRQDIAPVIDHVNAQREMNEHRHGWQHAASIPRVILVDWLNERGLTMNEFYVNPTVRQEFIQYFISRDFAKLHNQHLTTKRSDRGHHFTGGGNDHKLG